MNYITDILEGECCIESVVNEGVAFATVASVKHSFWHSGPLRHSQGRVQLFVKL